MSHNTIMAYSNYPIFSYREDDVNDVLNIDCNLDSYSDFLGRVHNFKNINMLLIMVKFGAGEVTLISLSSY